MIYAVFTLHTVWSLLLLLSFSLSVEPRHSLISNYYFHCKSCDYLCHPPTSSILLLLCPKKLFVDVAVVVVDLGMCLFVSVSGGFITCRTAPQALPSSHPVTLTIDGVALKAPESFRYNEDPFITGIQPKSSFFRWVSVTHCLWCQSFQPKLIYTRF